MRYLFTTLPTDDLGLVTRALPIARAVAARGPDVVFSSAGAAPSRLVASSGFDNVLPRHPIFDLMQRGGGPRSVVELLAGPDWEGRYRSRREIVRRLLPALPLRTASTREPAWDVDHASAQMGMLNEGFVRAAAVATAELIEEQRVDVVVDCWNPFAAMAARATGTRHVTVIQADTHPAGNGFIWWRPRPEGLADPVPTANSVLAELGVEPVRTLADLSVGDLTLVVGTPATDPLPADAGVTYIGPAVWQDDDAQLPAHLDGLGMRRPVVWLYAGNPRYGRGRRRATGHMDSGVVLRSGVAALADLDVDVVLSTGHHDLPEDLALPANVQTAEYVPGLAMAQRSTLMVHHGGYGSCQTGLLAGTPAVIMPTYPERESNARRIEALGAGVMVPVDRSRRVATVDVDLLRDTISHALDDADLRRAAQRVGRELASFPGPDGAAELIVQFAAGAPA